MSEQSRFPGDYLIPVQRGEAIGPRVYLVGQVLGPLIARASCIADVDVCEVADSAVKLADACISAMQGPRTYAAEPVVTSKAGEREKWHCPKCIAEMVRSENGQGNEMICTNNGCFYRCAING